MWPCYYTSIQNIYIASYNKVGGEAGIRTLGGGSPLNGFQDRRFRPLSHLSLLMGESTGMLRKLQPEPVSGTVSGWCKYGAYLHQPDTVPFL